MGSGASARKLSSAKKAAQKLSKRSRKEAAAAAAAAGGTPTNRAFRRGNSNELEDGTPKARSKARSRKVERASAASARRMGSPRARGRNGAVRGFRAAGEADDAAAAKPRGAPRAKKAKQKAGKKGEAGGKAEKTDAQIDALSNADLRKELQQRGMAIGELFKMRLKSLTSAHVPTKMDLRW